MTHRPRIQPESLILLILVSLSRLHSSHGLDEIRECVKLYVGGSRIQPQLSGHYILQDYTYNGRLVYQHTCSQYALFNNISANSSVWVVGRGVGYDVTMYVKSTHTGVYPRDVTSWRTRSREDGSWVTDSDFVVTCIDSYVHRHCRTMIVRGHTVPASYVGPYVIDGYHGEHVKYRHKKKNLYLFHHDDGQCRRWIVGPKPGENVVAMQSLSNSQSPFEITEKWMILVSDKLSLDIHTVQIQCTDYDERVYPCGRRLKEQLISPYIFSAASTYPGKWPFMVSYIRPDGVHKCGATLISRKWAITAGHCVSQSFLNRAQTGREILKFGAYDLADREAGLVQTASIKSIHLHPRFTWILKPFRLNYDIALIELSEEISYTDRIQPACLPAYGEEFPFSSTDPDSTLSNTDNYTDCHMVGWGQTDISGGVGGKLQESAVTTVMNLHECYDTFYSSLSPQVKHSTSVCLFGRNGGRMCKGDSGSPLFCERGGQWTLLGLGGWSMSQCIDLFFHYPSVYTDVSVFRDWIIASMYGQH